MKQLYFFLDDLSFMNIISHNVGQLDGLFDHRNYIQIFIYILALYYCIFYTVRKPFAIKPEIICSAELVVRISINFSNHPAELQFKLYRNGIFKK
jgi:hypothetical protein